MNDDLVEVLRGGGIAIFPTDTAFGIGCRMDNDSAVRKVYEIRQRPPEKAMLVLVGSVKMAEEYVDIPKDVREYLIEKYWPGGLTIILKCKKTKVPSEVRSNGDNLAVRLPDNSQIVSVINKLGVPIIAPSANYSEGKTPFELSEVENSLQSKVDFVLDGVCTMKGISTIVDTTVLPWKIIREGVVKLRI